MIPLCRPAHFRTSRHTSAPSSGVRCESLVTPPAFAPCGGSDADIDPPFLPPSLMFLFYLSIPSFVVRLRVVLSFITVLFLHLYLPLCWPSLCSSVFSGFSYPTLSFVIALCLFSLPLCGLHLILSVCSSGKGHFVTWPSLFSSLCVRSFPYSFPFYVIFFGPHCLKSIWWSCVLSTTSF